MSSGGIHVHGPMTTGIEHATHGHTMLSTVESHGGRPWSTNKIAMFTAIVATVGAISLPTWVAPRRPMRPDEERCRYQEDEAPTSGITSSPKAPSSQLAELARVDMTPSEQERHRAKAIDRYETEKNEIKKAAEGLEAEARAFDESGEAQMHQHTTAGRRPPRALQVAIALAAIALLARKNGWNGTYARGCHWSLRRHRRCCISEPSYRHRPPMQPLHLISRLRRQWRDWQGTTPCPGTRPRTWRISSN